jgi:phosphate transport system substrate-binding protein
MNKKILLLLLILLSHYSCSTKPIETAVIRIKGSDTMLHLTEQLAKEYMKLNPGISIYVESGGTSEGVQALIRGEADICTASRLLKPDESKLLADYYGTLGMFFLIAKDALTIYINPENPVKNLTLQQLKEIYTCQITNWKELGGGDEPIIPIMRNPNSGTHLYFKEYVLGGEEYCKDVVIEPLTENVIEKIIENENAIGYGGIGFTEDVYHASIEGIKPTEENARNDAYPITRYLHFFTQKTPGGAVKDFIDWVLRPEGQKIINDSGYIPLWELPY